MGYLRVDGTDFNLDGVTESLEDFKKEHEHGFAMGKSESRLKAVHAELLKAKKKADEQPPVVEAPAEITNANPQPDEQATGAERAGAGDKGKGGNSRQAGA